MPHWFNGMIAPGITRASSLKRKTDKAGHYNRAEEGSPGAECALTRAGKEQGRKWWLNKCIRDE